MTTTSVDTMARREAEDDPLRASDTLRALLQFVPAAIAMFDRQMCYLATSRKWREAFFLSQDIIGRSHYEIFPDIPESWRAVHRRGLLGETIAAEADAWLRDDGSTRFLKWQVKPWRTAVGEIGGILITTEDVTASTEAHLRSCAETFYSLVRNNPFGIYVVDASFRLREVSKGAQNVFGNISPLVGRDFAEVLRAIWTEPFASQAIAHFRRTLETGEAYAAPSTTEKRLDSGLIEAYDWRIERLLLPDGQYGVVCYFYDLSERQRLEAALRASEERERERAEELEAVMRSVPAAIWISNDPECRRITGNPEAYRLLRMREGANISASAPADETSRRPFREFRNGEPVAPEDLPMQLAARTGKDVTGAELSLVFDDGVVRHLLGYASPLRDPDGNVRGAVSACIDITALKDTAAELATREGQLREASRRKDEFLATLAHELRNPLAPLRNGLYALRRSQDPAVDSVRTMMERQLSHLVRIVDELLDISRIDSGKVVLKREPVTVQTAVELAIEANRPLIESCRHALIVDMPVEPVWVDADLTRLSQVVLNLLANAAKYTPDGGRISLALRCEGGDAVLRVTDTGLGIPKEMLSEVFEMFTQVNHNLDRSQGGLGIGLALVRRLVGKHGGSIEAESDGPGRGSRFTVRLPTLPGKSVLAESPSAASNPAAAGAAGRLRVLIVDDNQDAAESLSLLLQLGGHSTRIAFDGPEALEAFREFLPDVVFLDIGLPGMSGHEVARRMREGAAAFRPVLVALTGWGTEEDKRKSHAAGFDFHLTKPADDAAVQGVLRLCASSKTDTGDSVDS